jgi:CRP-like cAMP-binding protein
MIWRITSETFNYGMQRYPKIAMGLLPVLASRTRWLISQYEDLSFLSVCDRTAKLLLELSDNGRQPINRREYTIYEMAARVATVPEAISRSLSFYRDLGVIESSRTTIIITKLDELAQVKQINSDFEIV